MHAIVLALALAHGSVDEPAPHASRSNVGPAGVLGVVAGASSGFVSGLGAAFATAYLVDSGHLKLGGRADGMTSGELNGFVVRVFAVPLGTFGGAMLGALIGSSIDDAPRTLGRDSG